MSRDDRSSLTRRGFFQTSVAGAAGLYGLGAGARAAAAPTGAGPSFDFTGQSAALHPDRVVDSACQFCNSLCRLKVSVKAGRVVDIAGEPADPVQAGGLCVKGPMMAQLVYNPHRLTTPLRRSGGAKGSRDSRFTPISWDDALAAIAHKLVSLRDGGEARAVANKTSGRLLRGTGSLVSRFFALLGSPNDTDVGPVCNDAGGDALAATFGLGQFTNGYGVDGATGREDLGSARSFLFFGTNQAETHPVTFAHLLRCRQRTGATLVVVDPRLTPTGAQADTWIAPKPHTDLAIVLAMLRHIIDRASTTRHSSNNGCLASRRCASTSWSGDMTPSGPPR
jgi:anaerobic selenocysteine-containing dehydrogenase